MNNLAKRFSEYCENNLTLTSSIDYEYNSLSICIIDCIYSLRAVYKTTTLPLVRRYAAKYMGGNIHAAGETVSDLICHIDDCGGPLVFADKILINHQKLGGRNAISKAEVCYRLAKSFRDIHIETIDDFKNFENEELLELVIRSVKGIGDAGTNYLFMLAGDPDRCKPDVHIHHCIRDVCAINVSNEDCQIILTDAVALLKDKYPMLTVRNLDNIIWNVYSRK